MHLSDLKRQIYFLSLAYDESHGRPGASAKSRFEGRDLIPAHNKGWGAKPAVFIRQKVAFRASFEVFDFDGCSGNAGTARVLHRAPQRSVVLSRKAQGNRGAD